MDDIFGSIKTEPEEVSSISLRGNTETPSLVAPAERIVDGTERIPRFDVNVSLTVDSERPRKKQRVIMEVVVPTVNQLRKKGIKDTPEMKLKKLFKVWFLHCRSRIWNNNARSTAEREEKCISQ